VSVDVRAQTFDNLFMRDIGEPRFQTPIVTAFGVLAIVLAGVGIFGLVSYVVAQRAREFGIRVAVGATRAQVWKTVMGEAIRPAAAGLAVGLGAAWWLQRFVEATAFSATTPRPGPPVFLAVSAVVILVVAVAALIPASRAARMDPVATLRAE
jgi:ABC-type antimicrobial peptide transport system permease subunit